MNMDGVRQLAAAVTMQAVKDYVNGTEKVRKEILKDLRSGWMVSLTSCLKNCNSTNVAEQLEFHLDEVMKNMGIKAEAV